MRLVGFGVEFGFMATNTGQCTKCRAVNAYTMTNCLECGARLPWADAVQGNQASGGNWIDDAFSQSQAPPTQRPIAPIQPKRGDSEFMKMLYIGIFGVLPLIGFLMLILPTLTRSSRNSSFAGTPAATITRVRVEPFTTAQGKPAQMVYVDWRSIGTSPVAALWVDIDIKDAGGRTVEAVPKQCVYAQTPGIMPNAQYNEPSGSGYVYLMGEIDGQAASATASIVKVESVAELEAKFK